MRLRRERFFASKMQRELIKSEVKGEENSKEYNFFEKKCIQAAEQSCKSAKIELMYD